MDDPKCDSIQKGAQWDWTKIQTKMNENNEYVN